MKEQIDALFYKQDEIAEALKCPVCHNTFRDPRILPCGDCICKACIRITTEQNNNQIIGCEVCHEQHANLDQNNLIENHILNRLLSIKPIEVYRNKLVEELKSNLIDIKSLIDVELKSLIDPRQSIKDYCSLLCNQVEEATKNQMQKVKECHDELIKQIEEFETKRLIELENRKRKSYCEEDIKSESKRCKIDTSNEEMHKDECDSESNLIRNKAIEFFEQHANYLKQADIKDEEIEQSIKHSIQMRDNIKQHILENPLLSDIKLGFIAYKHENLVGQLKLHVPVHFRVKSLEIESKKLANHEICSIECIEDYKKPCLLVMSTSANNFFVNVVNEKGKLVKQYEILKSKMPICDYKFDTAVYRNKALICLSYSAANLAQCSTPCVFYENNFIKLTKSDSLLSDKILCVTMSERACYFILEQRVTCRIYFEIYDIVLDKYQTYGLDSLICMPTNITSFRVFNQKFYLFSNNEIYVMDETKKILEKSFPLNSNQFYLTSEMYLIKFEQKSNKIGFYDFVGHLLDEYALPIETDLFEIKQFSNQRVLCYYKSQNHKITIIELFKN